MQVNGHSDRFDRFVVGRTPNAVTDEWFSIDFESSHPSPPVVLASIETFDGSDTASVRIQNLTATGFEIKVEEEQSQNQETDHTTEEVGYFAFKAGCIHNDQGYLIGETGTVTVAQADGSTWHTVNLQNIYVNPVILTQIMTINGPNPAHTRLRNVSSTSFEFQIEEWDYLDQYHTTEIISYLVIEQQQHQMTDGTVIEAGTVQTNHNWANVSFSANFSVNPVTLSHCQTYHGSQAVVTRERNVNPAGFEVRLQEEESNDGSHAVETVGYVAIGKVVPVKQDVYLKIEKVAAYSPVDPAPGHAYAYRRDCFRREGHEDGTITADEVELRSLTAVVFRPYTDATYTTIDTTPLIATDLSEPPADRRVPGVVIYTHPGVRLRIHVFNEDDQAHSLHMHGIQYGIDSDGAYPLGILNNDGVRSDQICPGASYTYEYDVTHEMTGAWVFHEHFKPIGENARLGLIGGLVVRDPSWPQADYEVPFFMHRMAGRRTQLLFDSGDINPGDSYSRTFDTEGAYDYECFYHPMFGLVRVQAGGALSTAVSILDNDFDPSEVTIAPGGTVTWTNNGVATHTVQETGSSTSRATHTINGRSFAGNTPVIEVESGKRIRWYVFGLDLGQEWHNFHPHDSHWHFGGQFLDNRSIGPAESFVVDTTAPPVLLPPCDPVHLEGKKRQVDLAAIYPVHCHVEPHVMGGMIALMRVKQSMGITEAYENSLGFPLPLDIGTFACPVPDVNLCVDMIDNGSWETLQQAPVFAVHGALLRTGKVMLWSGHAELGATYPLETALYDPATDSYNIEPFSDSEDLFCAGHTFLPDGRLVAGGGANQGQVKSTHIFDPMTETWTRLNGGELREFRWYPSMVTMPDGRVAIVSGTAGGAVGTVEDVEVLDLSKPAPAPGTTVYYWDLVTGSQKRFSGLYPGLHWLPSGDMFFSRTGWNSHAGLGPEAARFTFNGPTSGAWVDFAPMNFPDRKEGCSVILIDDTGATPVATVLVAGGRDTGQPAITACEIIDVSNPATTPGWQLTAPMNYARIGVSLVMLPDGKVMVVGGRQTSGRFDPTPVFVYECEIYDPATDSWAVTPPMAFPRQYHSVALLLADGRVLTSGGVDASLGGGAAGNQQTTEAYSPEYLSAGAIPVIASAPSTAAFGSNITINSGDAPIIDSVCLIAPGAITHHTDTYQRYIKLGIVSQGAGSLDVKMPADGNTAPPGFYMLFIVNNVGVPSVAHFIQLI